MTFITVVKQNTFANPSVDVDLLGTFSGLLNGNVDGAFFINTANMTASGQVSVDTIVEYTTDTGVTVDGVLLKDGNVNATILTATDATLSGDLSAVDATLSGDLSSVNGTFSGNADADNVNVTNLITATDATLSGDLNAVNTTLSGDLGAVGGTFSGNVDADNVNATNLLTATTISTSGDMCVGGTVQADTVESKTGGDITINDNIAMGSTYTITGDEILTDKITAASASGADITVDANFVPQGDQTLGTAVAPWKTIYGQDIEASGDLSVAGDLIVSGNTTTVSTTNLIVEDNKIFINSPPSAIGRDSGLNISRYQTVGDTGDSTGDVVKDTPFETGNALGGTVSTVEIANSVGTSDTEYYDGWYVKIISGTNAGEVREVDSFDGTGNLTMKTDFGSAIDATSVYGLYPCKNIYMHWDEGDNKIVMSCTGNIAATDNANISPFIDSMGNRLDLVDLCVGDITAWDTLPAKDISYDLGSPSKRWNTVYANTFSGGIAITGDLDMECNDVTQVQNLGVNTIIADCSATEITMGNTMVMASEKQLHFTDGIEIGSNTTTTVSGTAIAIGKGATGNTNSVAIGDGATASGYDFGFGSVAIGKDMKASARGAVAIGHYSSGYGAHDAYSISIGIGNATGNYSVAIGNFAETGGYSAICIGHSAQAYGDLSISLGTGRAVLEGGICIGGSRAGGTSDIAIGADSTTFGSANDAIAIGKSAVANKTRSTAIGYNARAIGINTISIAGLASGDYSTAMGAYGFNNVATASGNYGVAIGPDAEATNDGSVSVGFHAVDAGVMNVAVGYYVRNQGAYATAVGAFAKSAYKSTALGYEAYADSTGSVAIGCNARTTSGASEGNYSIAIGRSVRNVGQYCIAIGGGPTNTKYASITSTATERSIAMGYGTRVYTSVDAIAIGTSARAQSGSNCSIAIGNDSDAAAANVIAIGTDTIASGIESVVIGKNSTATMTGAVALGSSSSATGLGSGAFKGTASGDYSMSIGGTASGLSSSTIKGMATGDRSIALGTSSNAASNNTVALGNAAYSSSQGSISVGINSRANTGTYAIAIGGGSSAGTSANATAASAIAIGENSSAGHVDGVSIGNGATTSTQDDIRIGNPSPTSTTATAEAWGQIFQNREWDDGNVGFAQINETGDIIKSTGGLVIGGDLDMNCNDLSNVNVLDVVTIQGSEECGDGNISVTSIIKMNSNDILDVKDLSAVNATLSGDLTAVAGTFTGNVCIDSTKSLQTDTIEAKTSSISIDSPLNINGNIDMMCYEIANVDAIHVANIYGKSPINVHDTLYIRDTVEGGNMTFESGIEIGNTLSVASDSTSIVLGKGSTASNVNSIAIGTNSITGGISSIALGDGLDANVYSGIISTESVTSALISTGNVLASPWVPVETGQTSATADIYWYTNGTGNPENEKVSLTSNAVGTVEDGMMVYFTHANPSISQRYWLGLKTLLSLSTTIAAGSNGVDLGTAPGVINVADTSTFHNPGGFGGTLTIYVTTGAGVQTVTYTGVTATSFTGVSGGTGVMSTGGSIVSGTAGQAGSVYEAVYTQVNTFSIGAMIGNFTLLSGSAFKYSLAVGVATKTVYDYYPMSVPANGDEYYFTFVGSVYKEDASDEIKFYIASADGLTDLELIYSHAGTSTSSQSVNIGPTAFNRNGGQQNYYEVNVNLGAYSSSTVSLKVEVVNNSGNYVYIDGGTFGAFQRFGDIFLKYYPETQAVPQDNILIGTNSEITSGGSKSIVMGYNASTSADYAIAIGYNTVAKGDSVVIGKSASCVKYNAVAIGKNATAQEQNCVSIGYQTSATQYSTAIGSYVKTHKRGGVGLGSYSYAYSPYSVAIGQYSKTYATSNGGQNGAVAIGEWTGTYGTGIAIGYETYNWNDTNSKSIALGYEVYTLESSSIAIGSGIACYGDSSIVLGNAASTAFSDSIAIGRSASTTQANSIAMGQGANTYFAGSVAIGQTATASSTNGPSISIGKNSTASGYYSVCIGTDYNGVDMTSSGYYSVSIGQAIVNPTNHTVAIGYSPTITAGAHRSIVIGKEGYVLDNDAIAIGSGAFVRGNFSIGVGTGCTTATGYDHAIAVGYQAETKGAHSIALGSGINGTQAYTSGIAIGGAFISRQGANAYVNAIAIGASNPSVDGAQAQGASSISIGTGSSSLGVDAVAVGPTSSASGLNSTALGATANATGEGDVEISSLANSATDSMAKVWGQIFQDRAWADGNVGFAKIDGTGNLIKDMDDIVISGDLDMGCNNIGNVDTIEIATINSADNCGAAGNITVNGNVNVVGCFTSTIMGYTRTVVGSTHTIVQGDDIIACNTQVGAITITLPEISTLTMCDKQLHVAIVDEGGSAATNNITINADAADSILGGASIILSGNFNAIHIYSDGENSWFMY